MSTRNKFFIAIMLKTVGQALLRHPMHIARQCRQIFQRNAIADKRSACEGMYFLGLYCKIKNAKCDKWKQCQIHCRRRYSFFTVMLKCHNYISLHCFLRICMSAVTIIAAMNQTFISLLRASILLNFV